MSAPEGPPAWPSSRLCLDGTWEFIPGGHQIEDLPAVSGGPIQVPGLWEAQGHLDLDGDAWYRRRFTVHDPEGWWTLRFGAVMDDAEVYLNGRALGSHRGAFTPFDLACPGLLPGVNEIAVRVTEHPAGSLAYRRSAHGKQGWMNDMFPSPPSLYLTYGGIWQSVWLERHGPAWIRDCRVNADPDDLTIEVAAAGQSAAVTAVVEVLGGRTALPVPGGGAPVTFPFGGVSAPRWSPGSPALHEASILLYADGRLSDTRRVRFGLRTIRLVGSSFELNGVPFKMRSALVQGFSTRTLYGAQSRAEAEAEVRSAQDAGLNTLRLHIKAFDAVYLDVCDELGMLVHCDIPVAEPISYDELGPDGPVAEQCVAAAVEQVRRDRNHPSVILWSAMNELGAENLAVRSGPGYEGFARRLFDAIQQADPTRPVIENDWIEPDPERVFRSPLLTAHWYGRLSARYLASLDDRARRWAQASRPLLISEFGDWGLPDLDGGGEPAEFWRYGSGLSALVQSTPWPGSVAGFVAETQRYQGIADRLQIELIRRIPGVPGWCLTELTDVPQEFNGLLDLMRNPKEPAIEEIRLATQSLCPILVRPHWAALAGGSVDAELVIVNDGPAVTGAEVLIQLGRAEWRGHVDLPAQGITAGRPVSLPCGSPPGTAKLELTVRHRGDVLAATSYPLRVVERPPAARVRVAVHGDARARDVLSEAGAAVIAADDASPGRNPLVIGERSLSAGAAAAASWLGCGGSVLLLAQEEPGPLPLPAPIRLSSLDTAWGSTPFIFTAGEPALTALPQAAVLASELLSASPDYVYTDLGGRPFATETAVAVLKPPPGELLGTVVGQVAVGPGLLTVCQLPLTDAALVGDPLALALLSDLLRWSRRPRRSGGGAMSLTRSQLPKT